MVSVQPVVLSVGYEGWEAQDFVDALKRAGATLVVDVRRHAASRKRGFSKTALRTLVESRGIAYTHEPDLGPPVELLREYRSSRSWDEFRVAYLGYLESVDRKVSDLWLMASTETVCLLCLEADSSHCHRSLLIQALERQAGRPLCVKDL